VFEITEKWGIFTQRLGEGMAGIVIAADGFFHQDELAFLDPSNRKVVVVDNSVVTVAPSVVAYGLIWMVMAWMSNRESRLAVSFGSG